jgi:hypothetical protein
MGRRYFPEKLGKPHISTRLSVRENLTEFGRLESLETHTQVFTVKNAQTDISNIQYDETSEICLESTIKCQYNIYPCSELR